VTAIHLSHGKEVFDIGFPPDVALEAPVIVLGAEGDLERIDNKKLLTLLAAVATANAIRAVDSMDDIDWCSSNNSTPCALRNISVPLLITAMGASTWRWRR
jgi:hypothetical protein